MADTAGPDFFAPGPTGPVANGADDQPQIGIVAQYVKDLSFENPSAPAVYSWAGQPKIDVQFNIATAQVGDDMHETALKIDVSAVGDEGTAFRLELVYAGVFGLRNVPEEALPPFLLGEAPRLLFPFARRIVADAVRDGGFPPFMLDPIDFNGLYFSQLEQQQQAMGEPAGQA